MKSFVKYFGCGRIKEEQLNPVVNFIVSSYSDLDKKIIPFFDNYPLPGAKSLDLADFCKAALIMRTKGHLTVDGLEEIRRIKAGMNRGRK